MGSSFFFMSVTVGPSGDAALTALVIFLFPLLQQVHYLRC